MKKDTTDKLLKKERDFTSLKQAAKDPDYGYGYGKVTRKKGVADPRFSPKRKKPKAVKKAIGQDSSMRDSKKRVRKIRTAEKKAADELKRGKSTNIKISRRAGKAFRSKK